MERDPLDLRDGRGRGAERVRRDQGTASISSAPSACAIRRFPRPASSARRSAPRWRVRGPFARSRSRASSIAPSIRSATRPRSCATCRAARRRLPITFRAVYGAMGGAAAQHSETVYRAFPVRARAQAGGALGSRGHEGPAQERDSRQQPGDRVRARRAWAGCARRFPPAIIWCRSARPASSARAATSRWWRSARWCRRRWRSPTRLAKEGIEVEMVDPRSLVPLDEETILELAGQNQPADDCRRGPSARRRGGRDRRDGGGEGLRFARCAGQARGGARRADPVQPAAGRRR